VLVVDHDHDGRADRGDSYRVHLTVTNSGNVPLRNVRVADALVRRLGSSVSCDHTTLRAHASTPCESGLVRVTRAQAHAGKVTNRARARAETVSGHTVTSPLSTATLPVQRLAGHRPHHPHHPHHGNGHHAHHHHANHHHAVHHAKPKAKLTMTQYVLQVTDKNHNGRLQAGDSVRFGYALVNTGDFSLVDLAVLDHRLARFKLAITCGTTSLSPGASTTCTSQALRITPYQDKHDKLGRNFAYATAFTTGGAPVRSNSTKITLVRSTTALRQLADTGSDVAPAELWAAGGLLLSGAVLVLLGRRRRSVVRQAARTAP